jgi:putative ABC transport system permease protein
MAPGILHIVSRSIRFYKKPVVYQLLIIALLSAVITGSLLTGRSVKSSIKKSASERLGNSGAMISSGMRYFDPSLADRMSKSMGINCTGLLELTGSSQALISQKGAFNTHIFGVSSNFFRFHGKDSITINEGEVAVNRKLADYLSLKTDDELIILFSGISDIPGDAPFAPSKEPAKSIVLKVGKILEPSDVGNFSLAISQIIPMNIFVNLSDLSGNGSDPSKMNRLLLEDKENVTIEAVNENLKKVLKPSDIGLNLRVVKKTGETELTSKRVFIDETLINEIKKVIPSSSSLITYLGNRFVSASGSTPYSFVSALPHELYPDISSENGMVINRWLADDLGVKERDTIQMYWYSPDSLNRLAERSTKFNIDRIVNIEGIWADSLLMPDFPGIAGSESCTDWDAGVLIKMDNIRRKDEDYWNKFRGTPKAFINYKKGKQLFGNIFGPATAIRFPIGISKEEIDNTLSGALDPTLSGFAINNLSAESITAADESVDFGTLFISLGFFLILASIVLLSLSVSSNFDTKKDQIRTLFALGFKNRWIEYMLLIESGVIALAGCTLGSLAGYIVNILITGALNSVWNGAVQTNTLEPFLNLVPMISGFGIGLFITLILMAFKVKVYLKTLNSKENAPQIKNSHPGGVLLFAVSTICALLLFTLAFIFKDQKIVFSFSAGAVLLISQLLFWRAYFLGRASIFSSGRHSLSRRYYSFYPSNAITPILFIAAGIFAVFITSANRMDFNDKHLKRSGGTGGFLLWCESTIPVNDDLNSPSAKKAYGLDDVALNDMSFVQAKRSQGNDASCLNLNHITAPPLLGIDPSGFISRGSFSFSKALSTNDIKNPWKYLDITSENNTIYGIADQTVLEWGLKVKLGDTLVLRAENGQPLNIILAAGLKSSVFQGYVLIGIENFAKYYPSVSGTSIMLVDGNSELTSTYQSTLNERLDNNGINIQKTGDRLASFYEVTNTYLSVFGVFGALGMITGIAGLGFIVLRTFNQRKKEFALLLALGFTKRKISKMIFSEQTLILFAGLTAGITSAFIATFPSVMNSPDIPWVYLTLIILLIAITGLGAVTFSVRSIMKDALIENLKKE